MNVHGVGPQQQGWQINKNRQESQGNADSTAIAPPFTPAPPAASKPAVPVATENQEKGVIRLLQEGHFHGVADVRLQINFHEELQLAASQQAGAAWTSNTQEFMASLTTEVNTAMAGFPEVGAIDPLLQPFADAAAPFLNGGTDAPFDLTAAINGLTVAFNGLLSNLNSLDPAKTAATPVATDAEADTTSEVAAPESESVAAADAPPTATATAESGNSNEPAASTFSEAIDKLQGWFDQEIAEVQTTMDSLLQPPEPSAPRGKGVAYERFLATYHSLYAMGSEAETGNGSTVEGVQTEA